MGDEIDWKSEYDELLLTFDELELSTREQEEQYEGELDEAQENFTALTIKYDRLLDQLEQEQEQKKKAYHKLDNLTRTLEEKDMEVHDKAHAATELELTLSKKDMQNRIFEEMLADKEDEVEALSEENEILKGQIEELDEFLKKIMKENSNLETEFRTSKRLHQNEKLEQKKIVENLKMSFERERKEWNEKEETLMQNQNQQTIMKIEAIKQKSQLNLVESDTKMKKMQADYNKKIMDLKKMLEQTRRNDAKKKTLQIKKVKKLKVMRNSMMFDMTRHKSLMLGVANLTPQNLTPREQSEAAKMRITQNEERDAAFAKMEEQKKKLEELGKKASEEEKRRMEELKRNFEEKQEKMREQQTKLIREHAQKQREMQKNFNEMELKCRIQEEQAKKLADDIKKREENAKAMEEKLHQLEEKMQSTKKNNNLLKQVDEIQVEQTLKMLQNQIDTLKHPKQKTMDESEKKDLLDQRKKNDEQLGARLAYMREELKTRLAISKERNAVIKQLQKNKPTIKDLNRNISEGELLSRRAQRKKKKIERQKIRKNWDNYRPPAPKRAPPPRPNIRKSVIASNALSRCAANKPHHLISSSNKQSSSSSTLNIRRTVTSPILKSRKAKTEVKSEKLSSNESSLGLNKSISEMTLSKSNPSDVRSLSLKQPDSSYEEPSLARGRSNTEGKTSGFRPPKAGRSNWRERIAKSEYKRAGNTKKKQSTFDVAGTLNRPTTTVDNSEIWATALSSIDMLNSRSQPSSPRSASEELRKNIKSRKFRPKSPKARPRPRPRKKGPSGRARRNPNITKITNGITSTKRGSFIRD